MKTFKQFQESVREIKGGVPGKPVGKQYDNTSKTPAADNDRSFSDGEFKKLAAKKDKEAYQNKIKKAYEADKSNRFLAALNKFHDDKKPKVVVDNDKKPK